MTANEVRQIFLEYFKKHNHQNIRSSSLVPQDDPTLLFTNAGMVQFKRVFLGEEKRGYVTATTSQKCVRAGGKHNDLENVGYTARHHTFFEMLGNFSFGDYFKEKAIAFAWDLLTNGYKLPVDKLWVSVFLDDDEAYNIWHEQIGVPKERIVRLGESENFWAMGDTGPCGPCSEIHIDRGDAHGCGSPDCGVDCDCDRFLEIWNLVFMQFNRDENGTMTPLPKPSIDTGMGLERLASVIQDVPTNYDTDLFVPIMQKVAEMSGRKIGEAPESDVAMKVIADHSRAAAFLIGDGILPSNEGRGYVLRRIMRRAIRYGRNIGLTRPFLDETARVVFDIMGTAYPELKENDAFITNVIRNEEIRFSETLDKGLALLSETLDEMGKNGETTVPGDVIFKLYDTFGFPVDIVRDVVKGQGIALDMAGFDAAMDRQREQSRTKVRFTGSGEAFKALSAQGISTVFTGYAATRGHGRVFVVAQNGTEMEAAEKGTAVEIVTDRTPFYAESGGQTGDTGWIETSDGAGRVAISDTVKDPSGLFIHKGTVESGSICKGDDVTLEVDDERRRATALNHTATHILHSVLRTILGDHVKQSGSMVSPDRLRFDFTHFSQVDRATLHEIETAVNQRIRQNVAVETVEMDAEDALKTGATALFEEKYGDRVRVVSLDTFSREFCGGTHTRSTGDIGFFKIVMETSIAAGVRRIEALTGAAAVAHAQAVEKQLLQAAQAMKTTPDAMIDRVEKLLKESKQLEKELSELKIKMASLSMDKMEDMVQDVQGVQVIARKVDVENPAQLRDLADQYKDRLKSGIVVLGAESGGKALLIVSVSKDLTGKFKAGDIVKQAAAVVGGGGGGRPDMAQAGGANPEHLDAALEKAIAVISDNA